MVRVVYTPPPPQPAESPRAIPFTHHEILSLVAPFTRRGRHPDLAASDRAERRLRFKPVLHADLPAPGGQLQEVLTLENSAPEHFRLVRGLTDPSGLESTLQIEGTDAGLLLEQIEQVPLARQFDVADGVAIARSYELQPRAGDGEQPARWRTVLQRAEAHLHGVILTANAKTGRKMPAELELRAADGRRLRAPQDLLAVLGWEWRPMRQIGRNWRGSVRIAAEEPERTAELEHKLRRAVSHLARTLAGAPQEFHGRWQGARWRVTFQRALPMLIGLGLLGSAPLIQLLSLEPASLMRMFIFHAPSLLLIGIFARRELPVIEIPPFPRPLIGSGWFADEQRRTVAGAAANESGGA